MRRYRADLHVHTVLSPCAELDMGAFDIVSRCRRERIDIVAVTDHNAAKNCKAVKEAAKESGLEVICGLEVQSSEDIHVICLFPDCDAATAFENWVWSLLPPVKNRPESFGYQLVIDKDNNIIEEVPFLLVQGIDATADETIVQAHKNGGVAVLAHIDRPVYSYVAVLGLIPGNLRVDAVELSGRLTKKEAFLWREKAAGRTIIRSSDAHRLDDIDRGKTTCFLLERPCFEEIAMALRNEAGRRVLWPWE